MIGRDAVLGAVFDCGLLGEPVNDGRRVVVLQLVKDTGW